MRRSLHWEIMREAAACGQMKPRTIPMIPPFNEALADLLMKYCHYPVEDLIVAMESALDGLRDDEKFAASERLADKS